MILYNKTVANIRNKLPRRIMKIKIRLILMHPPGVTNYILGGPEFFWTFISPYYLMFILESGLGGSVQTWSNPFGLFNPACQCCAKYVFIHIIIIILLPFTHNSTIHGVEKAKTILVF